MAWYSNIFWAVWVSSHIQTLIIKTEPVSKILTDLNNLTGLSVPEYFISFCHHKFSGHILPLSTLLSGKMLANCST
jgi:hypothetical protein